MVERGERLLGARRVARGLQRVVGGGGAGIEDVSDGNLFGADVSHVGAGDGVDGCRGRARSGALGG